MIKKFLNLGKQPLANNYLTKNDLKKKEREQWIRNIAQCHWSFVDLQSGEAWNHMRKYL